MTTPTGLAVTRALAATLTIQALVTVASFTVPVIAPVAALDIGVDPARVGIYGSLLYIGAMTATLMSGGFTLRYGAIRVSQGALAICALGLAMVTGTAWVLFLASALIIGLGYGPTTPASSHIIARHAPPRLLSLVFSIRQTGVPIGGMIAGVLVPFLVVQFGWRGAAWGVALMCIAGALIVQPARREFDVDLRPGQRLFRGGLVGPLRLVMSTPPLRRLVLASFAFASTQMCFGFFLVTFLVSAHGWDLQAAGLALSVSQAAGIGARILWGVVADWIGRARPVLAGLAFGMTAASVATAFYPTGWPSGVFVALAAVIGATAIGWNGVYIAEVSRLVAPEDVSRATGGALFVTFFGVVVVPPVFGEIVAFTGSYQPAFLALAALTLYSGIMLVFARGGRVRKEGSQTPV